MPSAGFNNRSGVSAVYKMESKLSVNSFCLWSCFFGSIEQNKAYL